MQVTRTKALDKLQELDQRVRIIKGGSSAGKTICILLILIDYAIKNDGEVISVVTGTVPALRRGAYKDFIQLLKSLNRYKESQHNKSLMRYTFTNGSYIEMFSTDDSSKLRGARRDVLFVNEANTISGFDAYQELAIRTNKHIFLDYNPSALFWVDKQLIGQPDTDFITLTYKDNDALPDTIVKELEKAREKAKTSVFWRNWVRVYLDGLVGNLEGACIPDWKEIDTIPNEARLLGAGMDFGYQDPTTIILLYKINEAYIFDEVFYKSNTVLRDVSLFLKENQITANIIADSAEPKSIETLRRDGHSIYPCTKGRDSVNFGINLINQNEIFVTSRSKNLKRELGGYVWAKDKEGNTLSKPTGEHPDCIDAARYVLTDQLENPNKGKYFIY
jgi:phage terminase large subunit